MLQSAQLSNLHNELRCNREWGFGRILPGQLITRSKAFDAKHGQPAHMTVIGTKICSSKQNRNTNRRAENKPNKLCFHFRAWCPVKCEMFLTPAVLTDYNCPIQFFHFGSCSWGQNGMIAVTRRKYQRLSTGSYIIDHLRFIYFSLHICVTFCHPPVLQHK